jgi:hypothetical protein
MLDEAEWEEMERLLRDSGLQISEALKRPNADLLKVRDRVYGAGVFRRYFEMTGHRETNVNAIWHHRISQYGPPCHSCGKPLRTPQARLCAACGEPRALT